MKTSFKTYFIIALTLVLGIVLGARFFSSENEVKKEHQHSDADEKKVWTCSMHPQIRQDESGKCPICGMDLIPASQVEDSIDPDAIRMSKMARQLAQVETSVVGSKDYNSNLRFSGRLAVNQDRRFSITTNYKARVEKLYINDEGENVQKGQVIADLYAPEIQIIHQELELAKRQDNQRLLKQIYKKINNLELTVNEVQSMEDGKLKLKAPQSGVVTELMIQQGDNLKADQTLMTLANLSSLWAVLDIYENDLNTIKEGDELLINTPTQENLTGKVTFISPVLNNNSRSAKARIVIENPNTELKPGVFITAELTNAQKDDAAMQKLMVLNSAVLWTGIRSVVYKQLEDANGVYFKMTPVETGQKTSNYTEIRSGLEQGDKVVTHGAFTIDSEAQLADKPSMMNPKLKDDSKSEFSLNQISKEYKAYFQLKNALVDDNFEAALGHAKSLKTNLSKKKQSGDFLKILSKMVVAEDIEALRQHFILLSDEMIELFKSNEVDQKAYVQFCPMANSDNGAYWLSLSAEIRNPYYGESMLKCGEIKQTLNK